MNPTKQTGWLPTATGIGEQAVWVQCLRAALCAAYSPSLRFTPGVIQPEQCSHHWCHGVLDVFNRRMLEPDRVVLHEA